MEELVRLNITLNPNGVAGPAQRIASMAAQVVATTLRALDNDDLSAPQMQGGSIGLGFSRPEMRDEERREAYQNWILSKGFQDLARGIRETLEEADIFLEMLKLKDGKTTIVEVDAKLASIKSRVSKLLFPQLLGEVNSGLSSPMIFEAGFLSLQKYATASNIVVGESVLKMWTQSPAT